MTINHLLQQKNTTMYALSKKAVCLMLRSMTFAPAKRGLIDAPLIPYTSYPKNLTSAWRSY